ncbi:hypothetical protein [Cellulosimicrobium sp. ES-005]|uniref:Queuine tRNA-ribosyltransferase n=1 Tax=Cellulosimicrobium sp. ES-005 TaxID=3163031 RepID=A0AAU8FWV4_9MICO
MSEPLFLHASGAEVGKVAPLCVPGSLGAIYTVPGGRARDERAGQIVREHREQGVLGSSFLLDAARYGGAGRVGADAALTPQWLAQQWDRGLEWAMTDSGYVDRDRVDQLDALFDSAVAMRKQAPVGAKFFLQVPADSQWVSKRADEVRERVDRYQIPVAYMFGSSGDPLETRASVQGLLHLLGSPVPSALVRADHAALGALAGGAVLGAMGTSSGRRHIYTSAGRGRRVPGLFSVLLPEGLSFHRSDTLARAIGSSPEQSYWRCHHCSRCEGARLDDIVDPTAAFIHSIESLQDLAAGVLASGEASTAMASWKAKCRSAQFIHTDIAVNLKWDYPKSLKAWTTGS